MANEQTLVLNACYTPLDVVDWRRAITLWVQGKAEIVERHDTEVWSVSFSFKLPAVVRLLHYVKTGRRPEVPFTRANIYTRDGYRCQYCTQSFTSEDLTFDHVIPVSRGGQRSWDNIVASCIPCNRTKGNRTPLEAEMTLARVPKRPPYSPLFRVTAGIRKTPESWRNYLYWHSSLDTSPTS